MCTIMVFAGTIDGFANSSAAHHIFQASVCITLPQSWKGTAPDMTQEDQVAEILDFFYLYITNNQFPEDRLALSDSKKKWATREAADSGNLIKEAYRIVSKI